jgi:hypothetical protein
LGARAIKVERQLTQLRFETTLCGLFQLGNNPAISSAYGRVSFLESNGTPLATLLTNPILNGNPS